MNILAVVIPHSDRHTGDCSMLNFPLGLAYVLGAVRKHFPKAEIHLADFYSSGILNKSDMLQELKLISRGFKPDIAIYGGMLTRFAYILELSRAIKEVFPQAKQILGGSAAGSGFKFFLKDGIIDFLVKGEGEEAIIGILEGTPDKYSNILRKEEPKTPETRIISDIDSIPIPAYPEFMVEEYIASNHRFTGWRYMPMISSRGCPYTCNFCYPNFGRTVRLRSEDSVIDEMIYLKRDYLIDSIYFWDEIQFLNKGWMEKFCLKLIEKNVGLKWVCVSRASLFGTNDTPLLKLAKEAGCLRIAVGVESGNQIILDKMNKNIEIKQIETAFRVIRGVGIKATGTMLAGYPGENAKTIQDSIDFANRNLLKTSFYCLIPMPGSKIYEYCLDNSIIKDEYRYLTEISNSGGDASKIMINLTDMDDNTYREEITRANNLVKSFRFVNSVKYYGIPRGVLAYMKEKNGLFSLKINKRMFDTP